VIRGFLDIYPGKPVPVPSAKPNSQLSTHPHEMQAGLSQARECWRQRGGVLDEIRLAST
jgi:hypothetical protein